MAQNKYTDAKALFDRYGGCFAAMYSDGELDRFRAFGVPDDIVHGWRTEQRDRAWSAFLASGEGEKAAAFEEYIRCAELLCDEESLRTAQDWLAQNDAGLDRISAARMAKAVYRLALSVDAHRNMKKELHKGGNTMRKLTIKRQKNWPMFFTPFKVYIEDVQAGELEIDGVPCRKLGEIKNGQEVTFEIEHAEARLYVLGIKRLRNFFYEVYPLPEGNEDIVLCGKVYPTTHICDQFRFENATHPLTFSNRKRFFKTSVIWTVGECVIGCVIGCLIGLCLSLAVIWSRSVSPKTVVCDDVQITLVQMFEQQQAKKSDAVYACKDISCLLDRIEFSRLEKKEQTTVQEFCRIFMERNDRYTEQPAVMPNGMSGYTFVQTVDEGEKRAYVFFFKGKTAFWTAQFFLDEKDNAKYEQRIYEWASSLCDVEE